MSAATFTRLRQIGCDVREEPVQHVTWTDLDAKIVDANLDRERFGELYGVQTAYVGGPYAWDVEAVLERMMSGRSVGSQMHWD